MRKCVYTPMPRTGGRREAADVKSAMHIAIVEDSAPDRALIAQNLNRFAAERGLSFVLTEFQDGEDLVTNYAASYDVILMDIQMTFMDGMSAAHRVRRLDPDVVIVFITNAPQYAIEGYRVRAVDYILKPISWFSFSESLARALTFVKPEAADYIAIVLREGRTRLAVDRICYVEVQDHQLIYNTLDGKYVTKGTMADAAAHLTPPRFARCNRCYLVNLKYVDYFHGFDLRVNGDTLQVSRRQRKSFLDALNGYMNS